MPVFFIAEAGVNHNGDAQRALDMVSAARDAGADAVKFQTFTAEKVVSPSAVKAAYQARETGAGNQLEMIKPLEMDRALHERLVARCDDVGIEFMSTPFDDDALALLLDLGVKRLKVASGELVNTPFLEDMAQTGLPLIVSTGMATMDEVQEAVATIDGVWGTGGDRATLAERLTILHCTSNYPAAVDDVNLRAMTSIARETGLPVGYSDHTLGSTVSISAVALGATVIEKHFTMDASLPGPDHRASMEVPEMAALVAAIRDVERALGDGVKAPRDAEIDTRNVARRSVTAVRPLVAGQAIGADDVALMRPGTGIAPKELKGLFGRTLVRDVAEGQMIAWGDFG